MGCEAEGCVDADTLEKVSGVECLAYLRPILLHWRTMRISIRVLGAGERSCLLVHAYSTLALHAGNFGHL